MFDGALGKYKGSDQTIKLKEDAMPYHAKLFVIPTIHEPALKERDS